jgi:signal transduction histidine kinase
MAKRVLDDAELTAHPVEAVTRAAGEVAHDFNNILAVLFGRVDLMLAEVTAGHLNAAELRKGLLTLREATQDAAELLDRLRGLGAPLCDRAFARVDLNSVVLDAIEFLQPHVARMARALRVRLTITPRLAANPLWVSGQSSALREVLVNLLLNAIEAMPRGGVVSVGTRRVGPWVVLQVADTGVGMSKEVLARIATPYFTTKGIGGTGLGLCSTKELVARHGGSIAVESQEGRGTCFTIALPLEAAAEREQATAS